MALWDNRKQGQVSRDMASQRLDCFLSVVYLFPNCLEPRDSDLLAQRDRELTKIYQYGGYSFFAGYAIASVGSIIMKGRMPFFRNVVKHSILAGTGTFCAALGTEKIAAEMYYNRLLIQLADKYNFTPEEVMDLQRNLN
jgi:hypothetical protein